MKNILLLLLLLCTSFAAMAHDMWLELTPAGYELRLGHLHSDHALDSIDAYAAESVKGAVCAQSVGVKQLAGGSSPYVMSGACDVVMLTYSSGYWTDHANGQSNTPKTAWNDSRKSWLSFEYLKHIEQWQAAYTQPVSAGLELSPQQDPLHVPPGEKLRFVLSYQGKPVSGVEVAFGGAFRGATDDTGSINLRIRSKGLQRVSATLEKAIADDKADTLIATTTLQWEIK